MHRYTQPSALFEAPYGTVHTYLDTEHDMAQCVIKRRGNHPHDHVRAAENIDREIETTEVLNANGGHPNIIRMIEHFIEDEYSHLVLEFCNQGDLLTVQQREPTGRFDHSRSLAYFRDVVLGLQYMHKHNLAHRDLSLENIFVTDGGRCKIGDFGLSVDATVPTHASVGKMMYMAPEVVDGLKYDPKAADIWSLGVMLFVMLTGVPLFDVASSKDKLFRAVTRQGLDPVLTICQKKGFLSPAVADLLEKLLALNPDDRLYVDEILEHDAMLMQ